MAHWKVFRSGSISLPSYVSYIIPCLVSRPEGHIDSWTPEVVRKVTYDFLTPEVATFERRILHAVHIIFVPVRACHAASSCFNLSVLGHATCAWSWSSYISYVCTSFISVSPLKGVPFRYHFWAKACTVYVISCLDTSPLCDRSHATVTATGTTFFFFGFWSWVLVPFTTPLVFGVLVHLFCCQSRI